MGFMSVRLQPSLKGSSKLANHWEDCESGGVVNPSTLLLLNYYPLTSLSLIATRF